MTATPTLDRLEALQRRLAARFVITDIEVHGEQVTLPDGSIWWDVRPMVNLDENPPEFVDMAQEAIDYALAVGLVVRHPMHQHLVHVMADPDLWPAAS